MKKTILKLLLEIRLYLAIWCVFFISFFLFCFFKREKIYAFVARPILNTLQKHLDEVFVYTSIFESFSADIAICTYSAFFLSLPVLLLCIYSFIAKSLYPNEKKIARGLFLLFIFLFIIAVIIAYCFIIPQVAKFFLITQNDFAKPMLRISDYVSTFFHIIFGIALIFQFPLVIVGLVKFGIIKSTFLSQNRRIAIVIIFIVSAIITPPDVISQVVCAIILIGLYELTNLYIKTTHHIENIFPMER